MPSLAASLILFDVHGSVRGPCWLSRTLAGWRLSLFTREEELFSAVTHPVTTPLSLWFNPTISLGGYEV